MEELSRTGCASVRAVLTDARHQCGPCVANVRIRSINQTMFQLFTFSIRHKMSNCITLHKHLFVPHFVINKNREQHAWLI